MQKIKISSHSCVQFHKVDVSHYVEDFGELFVFVVVVLLHCAHRQQFVDVIHPHLD